MVLIHILPLLDEQYHHFKIEFSVNDWEKIMHYTTDQNRIDDEWIEFKAKTVHDYISASCFSGKIFLITVFDHVYELMHEMRVMASAGQSDLSNLSVYCSLLYDFS